MNGIVGVILAGGQGRRFGGANKALLSIGSEFLFEVALRRLDEQLGHIGINANRDLAQIMVSGAPVVPDGIGGSLGPLDGVLGAMIWARGLGATHVATVPVDVPLFPDDLVARLLPHAEHAPAFAIDSEGIAHGACAIWPVGLADALETKLRAGLRKVMQFHALVAGFGVRFDANDRHRFLNINTPHDLAVATVLLRELDGGLTSS